MSGMANKKYNWDVVERYFIDSGEQSGITLKDVSEKFDIPYQTVRRYAAKREWCSRRYRNWIKEQHGL